MLCALHTIVEYIYSMIIISVHTMNIISKKAKIGKNVSLGNFVTIHDNVEIGDNCIIDSYCEIGLF